MKLTTKKIMFILMSVLLVLVVLMGYLVVDRIMGFLKPAGSDDGESVQAPLGSDGDASSSPDPWQEDPNAHECDYTIAGETFSPTCDTLGYTLYSCECGKTTFKDYKAALGHEYGAYSVIAATCTTDGWTERTCDRCKKTERTNLTTASHSFGEWTQEENGSSMKHTCSECGIAEIRSLDAEQTWVLRITIQKFEGAFTHRQVVVDLADSDEDITYDVYVAEAVTVAGFDYADGVLTVSCTVNGENQNYAVPSDAALLTVHADGNVTTVVPEPESEADPDADSDAGEPSDEQND